MKLRSSHPARTNTALCADSQVLDPVARDEISDILPASEASFEELRSANAKLRANNAYLEESNSKSITVLVAAEAKLKQLFPVSQVILVHITLPCYSSRPCTMSFNVCHSFYCHACG